MQHEERNRLDAEYEIDSVLKHLLHHQNTAPFVADFFIKRFVSSNPSPAYIEAVANAFTFGKYEGIGSGRLGDLSATIAATLLYHEALNPTLKSDSSHGKLREPILKVVHLMRSMELISQFKREVDLYRFEEVLGQEPYSSPTVFNYYHSKFQPNSAVKRSDLYAPEAEILTTSRVILFLNSMISMIEFGLTQCYGSMGLNIRSVNCQNLKDRRTNPNLVNSGYLNYNSSILNTLSANQLVHYFSTILTGGRLENSKKEMFSKEFQRINSSYSRLEALKVLLELIVSSPEYQVSTTAKSRNLFRSSSLNSNSYQNSASTENGYKAIVYVYLSGGMDSYSLLVPHSECGSFDLFQNYQDIRTSAALKKGDLLSIDVPAWNNAQPCKKFGVIGKMPFLRELYNSSEAAFIANIGALVEPLTKSTYLSKSTKKPIALFAHEMQTQHTETIRADAFSSNGILGRIRDQFTVKKLKTSSYSVYGGYSLALEEAPGESEGQFIIDPNSGINLLDAFNISRGNLKSDVLNLTSSFVDSIMSDTWNDILNSGMTRSAFLAEVLNAANVTTDFKTARNIHFNQMEYISRTIASRSKLNSVVDVFSFRMNGFDTHNSFTTFGDNMATLDSSLRAFVTEMKRQNVWENVVVVVASEFARTLRSNGFGTDHAWGGNTFLMGGSVRGGQILGKFPSRFDDSDINIGNGILIPTTPWEGMWNGISQWIGIDDNALDKVLPNRKNFLKGDYLFTREQLFKK
jgi:cullin-associated NEDD8-dissociated protein 1